jgi:hypothetical protein
MNPPVIVVHQGFTEYLKFCLLKARQYNPSTPIVLIGNDENQCLVDVVPDLTHIIQNQDTHDILLLKKKYRHRSKHGYFFELICLIRWFYSGIT